MIATLRALLRTPPDTSSTAKAGGDSAGTREGGKTLHIIAATSRSDAACSVLNKLFEETCVVPLLAKSEEVQELIKDLPGVQDAESLSELIIEKMPNGIGCKSAIRLVERAISTANRTAGPIPQSASKVSQMESLE